MEQHFGNLLMDECPPDLRSPEDDSSPIGPTKHLRSPSPPPNDSNKSSVTKGVAMSFGFKRRTPPSIAANPTAARRLANIDGNGNTANHGGGGDEDTDRLMNNVAATGRSTPRLAPPKKEASGATRVSRFGFRQAQGNRQNKVADLNYPTMEFLPPSNANNNLVKRPLPITRTTSTAGNDNNNRNRIAKVGTQPQIGKFTLQTTQLPRPEPVRLIETKTAKTLANNNKRAGMYKPHLEETSSKDGSLTEDSGVGSHISGMMGENELLSGLEHLDGSPTFGVRRRSQPKPRNLEVVVTSSKTFDVRDLDDSNDSCDSIPPPPLPQLPSAFNSSTENRKKSYQPQMYQPTGLVRERTLEYHRHLVWDNRGRKTSVTSSEGFSDDYGEEEKTYRDIFRNEKTFVKSTPPHQAFLKSRTNELKEDSSPPSSDEHDWGHGGEAMADEISFSLSSSDESKDKNQEDSVPISAAVIGSALQSLMNNSLSKAFTHNVPTEIKNVLLTIEDPKFAAVAAASSTGVLLDDETLISPIDSISCSETEEIKRKFQRSSSDSKDVNEKPTPPTPGTPTNASNSLSLSDGKDDFLIDDEIADQPALVFEERMPAPSNDNNLSQNNSEATPTIVESTPKPKRKVPMAFEGSPLSIRSRKFLQSRTGSLDTLSPCESIASDDLMMDYEYSQSSGLEECDRQSGGYPSLDSTLVKTDKSECSKEQKDWNVLGGSFFSSDKPGKSHTSRPRLLRSRAGTPTSVPDSPRSLDSKATRISRPTTSSPAKPRFSQLSTGYDSDDSIRLDRANHTAMKQDIISIKTMLLKLRRVLNETDEDTLLRSETHNPFENQAVLTNGIFNSLCPSDFDNAQGEDNEEKARFELAELRRQVLFLQGQLEDKEKTVLCLQEQMVKISTDNYHANSAPASTVSPENQMCNAATQTERLRPISAGPSLLNGSAVDGSALVSATETSTSRRSRPINQSDTFLASKKTPKLWRQPGEPPSPQRYTSSSIPRRANSRTRMSASTS